ncbi:MAG TPA: glycosyltransferase [Candidatus Angelobacter sp.]
MAFTIAGIVSVLIWIYLLLARGGFWQARKHLPGVLASPQKSCRIAVIVPARDEAETIGRSITSLLHQSGIHTVHIFVVDDASSDGTAEIARQAAAQTGKSSGLTVIEGRPLAPGWTGKLWAVQQGIERAREFNPEFFLFTDADILHAPDNIAVLAAIAASRPCDLASFMVRLQCGTTAEKFLVPAFVFFFFTLYPPAWIQNRRHKTAGAAGGSILVRTEALDQAGGIEAIRSEIIDDCALARAVKRNGGRVWLGLTEGTVSLRSYETFGEAGKMISRNAFNQLNHSAWLLLGTVAGLIATYLLPPSLLLAHRALPVALGATAWLLMAATYLPMVRFYRLNPLWSLILPLTAIFYMGATFHSAIKFWAGRGGEWKGRAQDRLP